MGFNFNGLDLRNLPMLLLNYTEQYLTGNNLNNLTENIKLYTLDLMMKTGLNETSTIKIKENLFDLVIKSIQDNNGNLTNFSNSSIIYLGKQISIQISDNSDESKEKSKMNNLAIVDYSQCEKKLKTLGIINTNEDVRSVILNSKNITNNIQGLSISTKLIDSQGNIIDKSMCDSFTVLLPTQKNLQNLDQYNLIKNLSADIYNSKDSFFNDICFSFQGSNSSDITISSRRDTFNVSMICSENCTYGGLDSDFYTICDCLSIENNYNLVESSIFDPVTTNNLALIKCYKAAFNPNTITKQNGFWIFLGFTLIVLIISIVQYIYFDTSSLIRNYSKIMFNDALTNNIKQGPQSIGTTGSLNRNSRKKSTQKISTIEPNNNEKEYEINNNEEIEIPSPDKAQKILT